MGVAVLLLSLSFCTKHAAVEGSSSGGVSSVPLTSEVQTQSFEAIPHSPECWKSAIVVFRKTQDLSDDTTASFCKIMPEEYQKLLALLIAQCHLEDLGKPLFKDVNILASECIHHGQSTDERRDILQRCLKQLTDAGASAYTHYVSYVQQLCTRLTQELLMRYQQEVQKEAADRFSNISMQSIQQLETISELAQRHSDQMEALSHVPKLLKDQLTKDIKVALADTVRQSLQEQLERHQNLLKDKLEVQISELLQAHLQELEEQYEMMKEQNLEMDMISKTLSKVMQIMQPLVGLESLITATMKGYSWATLALHLAVTLNVVWIVSRYHPFRSYLCGIVLTEAAAEIAIGTCVQYEMLTEHDRVQKTTELRRLALFLECSLYVVGLILALFLPRRTQDKTPKNTTTNDELEALQRRHETLLHQLEDTLEQVRARNVERRPQPQTDRVASSVITPLACGLPYRHYGSNSAFEQRGLAWSPNQYPVRLETREQQEALHDSRVAWSSHYPYNFGAQEMQLHPNAPHYNPSGPRNQQTPTHSNEKYRDALEDSSRFSSTTRSTMSFVPANTPSASGSASSESNSLATSRKRPAEALKEERPQPKRSKSKKGCL